jgi:hypothetical protein
VRESPTICEAAKYLLGICCFLILSLRHEDPLWLGVFCLRLRPGQRPALNAEKAYQSLLYFILFLKFYTRILVTN